MIKTALRTAIAAIIATTALTANAQDLQTEVDIRYEETPELKSFNKLAINPTVKLPTEKMSALPYSTRSINIKMPGNISILEPAAFADTIYSSPFRGYAALGFMTKFNLAASAGYKILDNDHTRLNAWIQYDGAAYEGEPLNRISSGFPETSTMAADYNSVSPHKQYMRRHTGTIGANLHQAVGRESFIDAGIDYMFSRYNTGLSPEMRYQNINRVNVEALWSLRHKGFDYGLGADYHHFAYSNLMGYDLPVKGESAQRETRAGLKGFFSGSFAGASKAGIDIELSHLSYPYQTGHEFNTDFEPEWLKDSFSHTLLSLTPYYRFDIQKFHLDLGARIDMTFNDGKFFHIAPRASATWIPADIAKIYIKADGGEWQNTLSSLFDITPYELPYMAYHNSHIPITAEAGVIIGSWRGFHAEISAAYALANDWLMPIGTESLNVGFQPVNLKGYKLRGAVGYRFRDLLEINASYEAAPQKYTHGYYLWRDRAKSVANVDFTITPISALDVTIGWEYRGGRAQFVEDYYVDFSPDATHPTQEMTPGHIKELLRSVNNLKAGALYRITPQWSAFLRGENLLNRHCYLIGGQPAQGITGLIGATYKF